MTNSLPISRERLEAIAEAKTRGLAIPPQIENQVRTQRQAQAQPTPGGGEWQPPELRGGNLQAFESRDREFILSGPTGTGKSLGLLAKAHYLAEKYPKARILLLRKTRESMTDSVLVTFERDVLGDDHYLSQGQRKEFRHSYIYKNGSEIVVAGMRHNQKDQKAKIMSTDYDMILVFEATEFLLDEWEKLNTRLRSGVLPYQQLGGDCNPDAPTSWI